LIQIQFKAYFDQTNRNYY